MPLLATPEEAKAYLVLEHEEDDALVTGLLDAVEGRLQAFLERALSSAQHTEYLDGSHHRLHVQHWPIARRVSTATPQGLAPIGDVANPGAWVPNTTGLLYVTVDETAPVDTDYVESPATPAAAVLEFALASVADPLSAAGHLVAYRFGKDQAGGEALDVTVQLVQGDQVLVTWQHAAIADALTTFTQGLVAVVADAITAYDDLRLRFTATGNGVGGARKVRLTWCRVTVPAPTRTCVVIDTFGTTDLSDEEEVDAQLYRVDYAKGSVIRTTTRGARIGSADGRIGGGLQFWEPGVGRWKVIYLGGMDQDVLWPQQKVELRQSVLEYVAELYDKRTPNLSANRAAAQARAAAIPDAVKCVWEQYRCRP